MTRRLIVLRVVGAGFGALSFSLGAMAGPLPAIKAVSGNAVPECATPGRLMAFLNARNPSLDSRFHDVATEYMRVGEELGVRWDYAFFQMIMETGNLSFKRGNGKPGAVKPSQYNFAGLGATGGGEPGESFKDLESGVRAHLQHLLMYSGHQVADPVAERTRKVQEWGILTSWQKGFKKPITFADLAAKWAPGSNGYGRDIESVGESFYDDWCKKPDPQPAMLQEARKGGAARIAKAEPARAADDASEKITGAELARRAIERAKAEGGERYALGAMPPASATASAQPSTTNASTPASGIKILNETPAAQANASVKAPSESASQMEATVQTAALTSGGKPGADKPSAKAPQAPQAMGKCRVWTASYGGQKSVIIRSSSDQLTNFTVLDVNEGQEARETDAYIAAYAKGGRKVEEFSSQNAALERAFQLCPEG